jgi:hypothetical protein
LVTARWSGFGDNSHIANALIYESSVNRPQPARLCKTVSQEVIEEYPAQKRR